MRLREPRWAGCSAKVMPGSGREHRRVDHFSVGKPVDSHRASPRNPESLWSQALVGKRTISPRKSVLTTGEVAKICNVAPRTVSKWFDSGQLRGYRIPGSKDRRIPLDQLVRFMRAHGIPLEGLDVGAKRVLVVDSDREFGEKVGRALSETSGFDVQVAATAFEAGALATQMKPHVVVMDVDLPDVSPRVISRFVRSHSELRETWLIGMARGLSNARAEGLRQDGFNASLAKPFDIRALIECIDELSCTLAGAGDEPVH